MYQYDIVLSGNNQGVILLTFDKQYICFIKYKGSVVKFICSHAKHMLRHNKGRIMKDLIRTIRTQLHLNTEQFASMMGVSSETADRWESGKANPCFSVQKKLYKLCTDKQLELSGYIADREMKQPKEKEIIPYLFSGNGDRSPEGGEESKIIMKFMELMQMQLTQYPRPAVYETYSISSSLSICSALSLVRRSKCSSETAFLSHL